MIEYKEINGFENYLIYNDGRVYSKKNNKFIKTWLTSNNRYKTIGLSKNNIVKKFMIHRLVAEHFIDNPENLPEVNHINYNTCDNSYKNLEWITRKGNMKHCFEKHSQVRNFKECILINNGNIIGEYKSINELCRYASKELGLSYSTLNKYRKVGEYSIITKGATTIS